MWHGSSKLPLCQKFLTCLKNTSNAVFSYYRAACLLWFEWNSQTLKERDDSLPVLGSTSVCRCGGGFPGVKCSLLYVIRGVRGCTWWGCCTTGTLLDWKKEKGETKCINIWVKGSLRILPHNYSRLSETGATEFWVSSRCQTTKPQRK